MFNDILNEEQEKRFLSDDFFLELSGDEERLYFDLMEIIEEEKDKEGVLYLTDKQIEEGLEAILNHDTEKVRELNERIEKIENQIIEEDKRQREIKTDLALEYHAEEEGHLTTRKGDRLEKVVNEVLDEMKDEGAIDDYTWLTKRYRNKKAQMNKPDFNLNKGKVGLECKNWNPEKKTSLNPKTLKSKIVSRFGKNKSARKKWNRRIVIIPKIEYGYEQKVCEKIVKDEGIEFLSGFSWIGPEINHYPTDEEVAKAMIGKKLRKLLSKESTE